MPEVASSWHPSSCLALCIVHQLVQLHERLHQGPVCVWGGCENIVNVVNRFDNPMLCSTLQMPTSFLIL